MGYLSNIAYWSFLFTQIFYLFLFALCVLGFVVLLRVNKLVKLKIKNEERK